jgi:hypothetical protein
MIMQVCVFKSMQSVLSQANTTYESKWPRPQTSSSWIGSQIHGGEGD